MLKYLSLLVMISDSTLNQMIKRIKFVPHYVGCM